MFFLVIFHPFVLFNWVIFRFNVLIFRGVNLWLGGGKSFFVMFIPKFGED